jgi:membrane protein
VILRALRIIWRAVRRFDAHGGQDRAATVAYYTLLSLVPLLVFLISVTALVLGSFDSAYHATTLFFQGILDQVDESARANLRDFVRSALRFQLPGIILLAWTARRAFRTLISALEGVFGVRSRSFARGNLLALYLVFATGIALLATLSLTTALATVEGFILRLAPESAYYFSSLTALFLGRGLPILITLVFFFLLYRIVPRRVITTRFAVYGALLATVLWETARTGFAYYVRHLAHYAGLYGTLEAIVILALWLEVSASIILFCGEIVAELMGPPPSGG